MPPLRSEEADGGGASATTDAALLCKGRYRAELATARAAIAEAQALRARCFGMRGRDRDDFDDICTHVLVREAASGDLVCCFRLMVLESGRDLGRSYSAQFYDLSGLARFAGRMAEMGRFCVRPERRDPDILRLAWGAATRLVDEAGVRLLFGCTSFAGTDPGRYRGAFALLGARHLAPRRWRPRPAAAEIVSFPSDPEPEPRRALAAMPPLLRSYLGLGGWVSDHAVIDRRMNTLHVFTGVEVARIPPARKRLLRALAGDWRGRASTTPPARGCRPG